MFNNLIRAVVFLVVFFGLPYVCNNWGYLGWSWLPALAIMEITNDDLT
jgi:hypothetical protein